MSATPQRRVIISNCQAYGVARSIRCLARDVGKCDHLVAHVIRVFERHHLQRDAGPPGVCLAGLASTGAEGVVCDETLLGTLRNRP